MTSCLPALASVSAARMLGDVAMSRLPLRAKIERAAVLCGGQVDMKFLVL